MAAKNAAEILGARLKRLRQARGMSRIEVANGVGVDISAVAGWEAGKFLPRDQKHARLARILGVKIETLLDPREDDAAQPLQARTLANEQQLVSALVERLNDIQYLRALRFSYAFPTARQSKFELRQVVSDRILSGHLELQRTEVFFDLGRLKEILANMFRFDGKPYWIKSYVLNEQYALPCIDLYLLNDSDVFLSSFWNSAPPHRRPRLQLSGGAIGTFFRAYWEEVWNRAQLLNIHGTRDLSLVREIARRLGLKDYEWADFVDSARHLELDDGAPPLP